MSQHQKLLNVATPGNPFSGFWPAIEAQHLNYAFMTERCGARKEIGH